MFSALHHVFLMRGAFQLPQTSLRCETPTAHRQPVARKVAALQPNDAGLRRLGRAKILPRAGHISEYPPARSECFAAALRLSALRQAFPRPLATRPRANCYSTTPATARVLLPAPLLQSVR